MAWLKKNYQTVALLVAALVLGVSAWLIFAGSQAFVQELVESRRPRPKDNTVASPPTESVAASVEKNRMPPAWASREANLFVSRPYIVKEGKLIDPTEGTEKLHPPVENAWLNKYQLDLTDANILSSDPDGDNFSVLEEYQAQTDPTSAQSIPPYWTKLRLKQFVRVPFRLKFNGSPDEGQSFSINTIDLRKPTQFPKLGEMVEGTPFKVVDYQPKKEIVNDIERNVSELTIENTETGEKIVLVNEKVVDSPTSFALFAYLYDGTEFQVKKDDNFSLEPVKDIEYKLIDISEEQAVIQEVSSGQKHNVPRIDQGGQPAEAALSPDAPKQPNQNL